MLAAGEGFMASSPFVRNVTKLASGATISAGQVFANWAFPELWVKNNFSFTGKFLNSSTGFVGIRFNQGTAQHFGWIRGWLGVKLAASGQLLKRNCSIPAGSWLLNSRCDLMPECASIEADNLLFTSEALPGVAFRPLSFASVSPGFV
jgi:hypothetical protein